MYQYYFGGVSIKKLIAIVLSLCVFMFVLSGCGGSISNNNSYNSETSADNTIQKPASEVKIEDTISQQNEGKNEGTISQQNAVKAAKNYLDHSAFSMQGLTEQLEYEGYSNADAVYGVEHCGADWREQAVKCAKNYLDYSAFSRQGLIEQLEYEGFTHEQAIYGAESSGLGDNSDNDSAAGNNQTGETVSQQNAVKAAKNYLDHSAFSMQGLTEQLEYEGYSNADAVYGVDHCGADWKEQAVKCAKNYLDYSAFSRQGLIEQLEYEGFTHEQAVYGVDATGL